MLATYCKWILLSVSIYLKWQHLQHFSHKMCCCLLICCIISINLHLMPLSYLKFTLYNPTHWIFSVECCNCSTNSRAHKTRGILNETCWHLMQKSNTVSIYKTVFWLHNDWIFWTLQSNQRLLPWNLWKCDFAPNTFCTHEHK